MHEAGRRGALVLAGAALSLILAAGAPLVLRHFATFRVERVEVVGTHLLPAAEAVRASGISTASNVFDDVEVWRDSLCQHPLVADVQIGRRLPHTVVLDITETTPVALARTPELRPVDAHAHVLPVDPATVDMDLPILDAASQVDAAGTVADEVSRHQVALLVLIGKTEPAILGWISDVSSTAAGDFRLTLRVAPRAEVLLPGTVDAIRLRELNLALADLTARSELPRLRRIDARFAGQLVVDLARTSRLRSGAGGRS